MVVVPGTGQGPANWSSFLGALRKEPRSSDLAWLVFDHGIEFTTRGSARSMSIDLAACIQEKSRNYTSITLIGHSIGGMLTRRAYLEAAGVFSDHPVAPDTWASKVDSILLFASVNRGVAPSAKWWGPAMSWLLRTFPHPHFLVEDLTFGSDFIADIRIAWIRYFGELNARAESQPPRVVQFWGTEDSVVKEEDNADLEAFSGPVIERVPGARHADLPRLELEYAADPAARWMLYREHLFDDRPVTKVALPAPRRVLVISRGIRDSSNSEWVADLHSAAEPIYGRGNVQDFEYGYFSAAHFAFKPLRSKMIPAFRDLYTEELAKNPLTRFDFIGHSNGTYILGQSLLSTPSMRFDNVVLAAPVLPTEFDWLQLFRREQVARVRYDTSERDWPVGILCPMLRAIGFHDVGPSGVVLFGEGRPQGSLLQKVGWHPGGHGDALSPGNRKHLLAFAADGTDLNADGSISRDLGAMRSISRATPYVVWLALAALVFWLVRRHRSGRPFTWQAVGWTIAGCFVVYVILDVV